MKVVLLYAYGTVFMSIVSLITDVVSMVNPSENSDKTDIVTVLSGLQIFWLFISIAAVCYFLCLKAPIRTPLLYTLYSILIMFVTVVYILAIGKEKATHLPMWLYCIDIGITLWIAAWAIGLVRYSQKRQKEERSAEL